MDDRVAPRPPAGVDHAAAAAAVGRAEAERDAATKAATRATEHAAELSIRMAALRAERRLRDRRHDLQRAALRAARDDLAASLAAVRRDLARAEADHAQAIAAAQEDHATETIALHARIGALRTERRARDRRHTGELAAARGEVAGREAQIAALRAAHDEATAALRAAHGAEIAELRAARQDDLATLRRQAAHAEATHTAQIAALHAAHQDDLAALRRDAERASAAHEEASAAHGKQIAELHAKAERVAGAHVAEILALHTTHEQELAVLRAAAQSAAAAHEAEVTELRERFDALAADLGARDEAAAATLAAAVAEAEEQRAVALRAVGEADALRHRVGVLVDDLARVRAGTRRARRASERDRDALCDAAERAGALEAELAALRAEVVRVAKVARGGSLPRRALRQSWVLGATAGALLVADGVTTLVWQEPISALYAERQQDQLRAQLPEVVRQFAAIGRAGAPSLADDAQRLGHLAPAGTPIGKLAIPALGVKFVMVQGTGDRALTLGPGHYTGTVLPGQPGTVGIAGHRTTYLAPFRNIDRLGRGARVVLTMPYGRFTYRVTGRRYVSPTNTSVLRSRGGAPRLVLTTCDPLFSDARRLVVFAKLRAVRRA